MDNLSPNLESGAAELCTAVPEPQAEVDRVLRRRAAELAAWQQQGDQASPTTQLVVFGLGQERWGIALRWVREVLATPPLRAIPGTPRWVRGVTLHRGNVLALVDLREFMGLPGSDAPTPWVVVLHGQGTEFGVVVQHLEGCLDVDVGEIAQARSGDVLAMPSTRVALLGVTADRLAVIDGARLLGHPDLVVDQAAQ